MAERNDPYGSLVGDLLGLGKIGEILLGSLSKLVGGIAAPHQARRLGLAQTDVEADRLIRMTEAQALADAVKSGDMGLRDRTGSRLLARELSRGPPSNHVKVRFLAAGQRLLLAQLGLRASGPRLV